MGKMKLVNGLWQYVDDTPKTTTTENAQPSANSTSEDAAPTQPVVAQYAEVPSVDVNTEDKSTNNNVVDTENVTKIEAPEPNVETPEVNTPVQAVAPQPSQEEIAYNQALEEKKAEDEKTLSSFRDLLDTYKPETKEERETRERMDRMRDNIAAASSMGAALGNLFSATSSNGRAVKTQPLNEGVAKSKERERTIRDARDARGVELRNRYLGLRKEMADRNLANTWNAWKAKMSQDDLDKKLALQDKIASNRLAAQKDRDDEANKIKRERLKLDADKLNFKIRQYNEGKDKRDAELERLNLANEEKKIRGVNGKDIKQIPIAGNSKILTIDKFFLTNSSIVAGAVIDDLPNSYFLDENGNVSDASASKIRKDYQDGSIPPSSILSLLEKYLNDDKLHRSSAEEWDRFKRVCETMTSFGGSIKDKEKVQKPTIEGF